MLKRLLLPVAAALFAFVAVPAQATTFNLDSLSVTLNNSGFGLLVSESEPQIPLSFDLSSVGETFEHALFTIGTDETALNFDDLVPQEISVGLHFSLPAPGYQTQELQGLTGAAWFFQDFGYVVWDNPLQLAFGNTGLLAITLSNTVFGFAGSALPNSAPVDATFTLLRADTGATPVPEPSSLALLGLGLAGLAAARRRRLSA